MVQHVRGGGGGGEPDTARAAFPGFAGGGTGRAADATDRGYVIPGPAAGAALRRLQKPPGPRPAPPAPPPLLQCTEAPGQTLPQRASKRLELTKVRPRAYTIGRRLSRGLGGRFVSCQYNPSEEPPPALTFRISHRAVGRWGHAEDWVMWNVRQGTEPVCTGLSSAAKRRSEWLGCRNPCSLLGLGSPNSLSQPRQYFRVSLSDPLTREVRLSYARHYGTVTVDWNCRYLLGTASRKQAGVPPYQEGAA